MPIYVNPIEPDDDDDDMPETIEDAIEESAKNPKSVFVDGERVEAHSLKDQIEADKYLNSKAAAQVGLGIRYVKLKPPGAAD